MFLIIIRKGQKGDEGYMGLPGYKYLKTYQGSVVIYDLTVEFCNRWVDRRLRTYDQMTQAARSGKQNIAEGYLEKSLKMYIKLLGVARASLGELLEDYEDFARQNGIKIWDIEKGRDMREIRDIWKKNSPHNPYIPSLPHDKEKAVNLMITLINQTCFMLDKQGAALEEKFVKDEGYSEKLFKRRLDEKKKK